MTQSDLLPVDISAYRFTPDCERDCGRPARVIAQGCCDKQPVMLCDECLHRGLEVLANFIKMWQRLNKRVFICGDCYRPVLHLENHLDVRLLAA